VMKEYNPGSGWQKAEDRQWQSALTDRPSN
jgi:hypothetical protein